MKVGFWVSSRWLGSGFVVVAWYQDWVKVGFRDRVGFVFWDDGRIKFGVKFWDWCQGRDRVFIFRKGIRFLGWGQG